MVHEYNYSVHGVRVWSMCTWCMSMVDVYMVYVCMVHEYMHTRCMCRGGFQIPYYL